jgi:hypothetical protein
LGGRERGQDPAYLEFNWWHDFQDESVALNNLVFDRGMPNDRFEAGVGFNAEVAKNWVLRANTQFGAYGFEGVETLGEARAQVPVGSSERTRRRCAPGDGSLPASTWRRGR